MPPGQENPAVRYCQEIQHVFSGIVERFIDFSPILEKACRCWRNMIFSYRIAIAPLLPDIMTQLALGFNASKQGCFLWATAAIVREFADGKENVDEAVSSEVFRLFQQQSTAFLRTLNDILPEELPDGKSNIEISIDIIGT